MMPTAEQFQSFMLEFDNLNSAYKILNIKFSALKAEYESLYTSFETYKKRSENELYSKTTLFDTERSASLSRIDSLTKELDDARQNLKNLETLEQSVKILTRSNEELKESLNNNAKCLFDKEQHFAAKEKSLVEEVELLKEHIESLRDDCEKYKNDQEVQDKVLSELEDQIRRMNKQQNEKEKTFQAIKIKNETELDEMKFGYETKILELQRKIDHSTSENERLKENSIKNATQASEKATKVSDLEGLLEEMKLNLKKKDFERSQSIEIERLKLKDEIEKLSREKMNDRMKYTSELENLRANLKIVDFEKSRFIEEVEYYRCQIVKLQSSKDGFAIKNQHKSNKRQNVENQMQQSTSMLEIPTIQMELTSMAEELKEKEEAFKNLEQQITDYKDKYEKMNQILKICQEKKMT